MVKNKARSEELSLNRGRKEGRGVVGELGGGKGVVGWMNEDWADLDGRSIPLALSLLQE